MKKLENGAWVSTTSNIQQEWQEVLQMRNKEMQLGAPVEAASMALTLLTPLLHTFNLQSPYSDSESIEDFKQEAYLLILKKLPDWDAKKESFATFLYTHLQGAARDIRNGELSEYQVKKLNGGVKIIPTEALQKQNPDNEKEIIIEFPDENSSTEEKFLEQQEYKNSKAMYHLLGDVDVNKLSELPDAERTRISAEFACMNLFLGGYKNYSEQMLNEVLNSVSPNISSEKDSLDLDR